MNWEVIATQEFEDWFLSLNAEDRRTAAAVDRLEQDGPALGRPWVDTLSGSRHRNMKELRPRGGHLRVLFAFDPNRNALLLVGGDKTGNWRGFYAEILPVADTLFDQHLTDLKRERKTP